MSEDQAASVTVETTSSRVTAPAPHHPPAEKTYRVGNLVYSRTGLLILFGWLLWCDFCFTFMEGSFGPILSIKLMNDLKADPWLFGTIMGTLPTIINLVMNPFISIRSDRHRGKRGRRIPFILYTAPVVSALLALLGFGNQISAFVHAHCFPGCAANTVAIYVFGTLYLLFFVSNMFVGCVFYYLFNDVVPREHLMKFMGYFRVVGALAGMVYGWYIYGYSDKSGPFDLDLAFLKWGFFRWHADHVWYPQFVLVGMALFYLVGMTLACLYIKEPQYPPPEPLAKGERLIERSLSTLKTLGRECFGDSFYTLLFVTVSVQFLYESSASPFTQPMLVAMGVNLETLGKIGVATGSVTLVLTLITANWGDRWHPMPLMLITAVLLVITAPFGLLFLIPGLSPDTYMWIQVFYNATHIPISVIGGLATFPFFMVMFPKDRYGQFSAAMCTIRSIIAGILGSQLASGFMKLMACVLQHGNSNDQYYLRYCFVWKMLFQAAALGLYLKLYREWKRRGGREGFKPPGATAA